MFYATQDTTGRHIARSACIVAYEDWAAIEDYLRAVFTPLDRWHLKIAEGEFSDYWLKMSSEPKVDDNGILRCGLHDFRPFKADQLIVWPPGLHGDDDGSWWITPKAPVMVAVFTG